MIALKIKVIILGGFFSLDEQDNDIKVGHLSVSV